MDLESGPFADGLNESEGQAGALTMRAVEAVLADAGGEAGDHEEGGWDREALEVLGLARVVLRDEGDGGVEAGEAGDSGADKDEEGEGVERGAEADGEGDKGGCDAERDRVGERVEFLTEHGALLPPPGDLAVEGVKDEAEDGVGEGVPEVAFLAGDHVVGGGEEGEGAAEPVAEGDDVGEAEVADETKVAVVLDKLAELDGVGLVLVGRGSVLARALPFLELVLQVLAAVCLGKVLYGCAFAAGGEGIGGLGCGRVSDRGGGLGRCLGGGAGDGRRREVCSGAWRATKAGV